MLFNMVVDTGYAGGFGVTFNSSDDLIKVIDTDKYFGDDNESIIEEIRKWTVDPRPFSFRKKGICISKIY